MTSKGRTPPRSRSARRVVVLAYILILAGRGAAAPPEGPTVTTTSATEAALAVWADGIIDVGLGRRPGADDWLVLALGDDRLVPVRTHPSVLPERLGLVVYADRPPSNRALVLLARVAAGDVAG